MKLYHCLVVIYACVLVSESLLADQPPQVIANDARLAKLIREGTTTEWNGIGKWSDANRKPVLITECVTNEDGDFDCGFDIPVDPTQGGALILFTTIPDDDIAYYPLINDQGMHFYSDGQRGLAAIRFTPSESLKEKIVALTGLNDRTNAYNGTVPLLFTAVPLQAFTKPFKLGMFYTISGDSKSFKPAKIFVAARYLVLPEGKTLSDFSANGDSLINALFEFSDTTNQAH